MANDVNSCVIIGRLTKDVEGKQTSGQNLLCQFTVAVNYSAKENGQWTDKAVFIPCKSFSAPNFVKYLKKGTQVSVVGSLRVDEWQDQNGQKKSKMYILVDCINLLGGRNG
mgnify:FL=1